MTDPRVQAIREALDSLDEAAHGWPDDNKYMRAHAAAEPALASLEGQLSFSARVAHQAVQRLGSEATGAQPTGGTTRADFAPSGTTDASQPLTSTGADAPPSEDLGGSQSEPGAGDPTAIEGTWSDLKRTARFVYLNGAAAAAGNRAVVTDLAEAVLVLLADKQEMRARVQELERERRTDEQLIGRMSAAAHDLEVALEAAEARAEQSATPADRLDQRVRQAEHPSRRKDLQDLADLVRRRSADLPSPERCRSIRQAAGVSAAELAAAVGVTERALNTWESGTRSPSGPRRDVYSEALGVLSGAIAPKSSQTQVTGRSLD